jgi:hypothetical protein
VRTSLDRSATATGNPPATESRRAQASDGLGAGNIKKVILQTIDR